MILNPTQKAQLIKAINLDNTLDPAQKAELVECINDDAKFSGLIGAGAGLAISKFLKLSTKAQILMTTAGFGIGKYLLDNSGKHDKFIQYNDKVRAYDITV